VAKTQKVSKTLVLKITLQLWAKSTSKSQEKYKVTIKVVETCIEGTTHATLPNL
jgi:hypothetical protein